MPGGNVSKPWQVGDSEKEDKKNCSPLVNETGYLMTTDMEKSDELSNIFSSSFPCQLNFPHISSPWISRQGLGNEVSSIVEADQIQDHLRNLNIDKSVEPDKMHPRVLRELADISCSLSLLKSHDSQAKSPVPTKGETLHPFIKCVKMDTPRTANQSASPLCLGSSWNSFS